MVANKELHYMSRIIADNYKGRKVVLWGEATGLRQALKKEYNIDIEFLVTASKNIINGKSIQDISVIEHKSNEYYLVSWGKPQEDYWTKIIENYGYTEIKDYVFRMHKPIELVNWNCAEKEYKDSYGNRIECKTGIIKKVIFKGLNNLVRLDDNIRGLNNLELNMEGNQSFIARWGTNFIMNTQVHMRGYNGSSSIYIGFNCRFKSCEYMLYNHSNGSNVIINDLCTFEESVTFRANSGKKIIIGNDCMFSHSIQLQAGDGHTIFDVISQKNMNSTLVTREPRKECIHIGNHVWVASKAYILNGTELGDGSIVGGASTVKGVFPNNCIVAGNPAKKVKENTFWSRRNCAENMEECEDKKFAKPTVYSNMPIANQNVLVVGGTRFMGIQLVRQLLAHGNHVTIATRGKQADPFGSRINRIILDLENPKSVEVALIGKQFDVVFNNLAYCSDYVDRVLKNVVCNKYIQLSSVAVYSPDQMDIKESRFNSQSLKHKWCDNKSTYYEGKRQSEATVTQIYSHIPSVIVRLPVATKTEKLYYYCKNIIQEKPMNIKNIDLRFTLIRDTEVGEFLPWIANQKFTGCINLSSEYSVSIKEIITYIESKTNKKAIIKVGEGEAAPFSLDSKDSFSLNMDKAKMLGYKTSNLDEWLWSLIDEYIERARKDTR